MPPCCWPSTSSGLSTVPQSSTATWRTTRDLAGVEVDLDDGDVGAERERGVALVEVGLGGRARRSVAVAEQPGRRFGVRRASSAHDSALAGTPATPTVPASVSTTMSATSASSRWAASCLAFSTSSLGGLVDGRAAELQRPRAAGAAARGDEVGVAVDEADALDRDAGLVVDEHGERRLVALAVGERAGPHGGRAVVVDLDGAELLGAAAGGDLDVGGDADAEGDPVAALAARRLLARAARRSRWPRRRRRAACRSGRCRT